MSYVFQHSRSEEWLDSRVQKVPGILRLMGYYWFLKARKWALILIVYLFHLYCEQSLRYVRQGSLRYLVLKNLSHIISGDFNPSSNVESFSLSQLFSTEGCCSRSFFYHSAAFNLPSMPNIAEQWVSSTSEELSVIEMTFSKVSARVHVWVKHATQVTLSLYCSPLTISLTRRDPQRTMTQGMSTKNRLLFWFYYLSQPRVLAFS